MEYILRENGVHFGILLISYFKLSNQKICKLMKCLLTACKPISWIHERTIMLQPHWILKAFFYNYLLLYIHFPIVRGQWDNRRGVFVCTDSCMYALMYACINEHINISAMRFATVRAVTAYRHLF